MSLKKLITFGIVTIMLLSMSVTAFAASLTTEKQSIISALQSAGVPASYVTQAQNYLASSSVTVTAEQAATINAKIAAAKATASNVSTFTALTADQKSAIAADLAAAGDVLNIKVTYNSSANSIKATDSNGNIILDASLTNNADTTSAVIKTTGVNMSVAIAMLAIMMIALAGCGVMVSKKRSANINE